MSSASDHTAALIRENWLRVSEQVAQACADAGRPTASVQIVGVSKYVGPELAWQLSQAGCPLLGENRPQALWDKTEYFASQASPGQAAQWHLIGHLQRNKVKRTLPLISLLHSLDSQRLAEAVSQEAVAQGRVLPALLEVNVTQDKSKTGMDPGQVERLLSSQQQLPGIEVRGLMAMSSLEGNELTARREFEQVRELRDGLQARFSESLRLSELSMGMSGDFGPAIAAGATLVRIGSRLWQGV